MELLNKSTNTAHSDTFVTCSVVINVNNLSPKSWSRHTVLNFWATICRAYGGGACTLPGRLISRRLSCRPALLQLNSELSVMIDEIRQLQIDNGDMRGS